MSKSKLSLRRVTPFIATVVLCFLGITIKHVFFSQNVTRNSASIPTDHFSQNGHYSSPQTGNHYPQNRDEQVSSSHSHNRDMQKPQRNSEENAGANSDRLQKEGHSFQTQQPSESGLRLLNPNAMNGNHRQFSSSNADPSEGQHRNSRNSVQSDSLPNIATNLSPANLPPSSSTESSRNPDFNRPRTNPGLLAQADFRQASTPNRNAVPSTHTEPAAIPRPSAFPGTHGRSSDQSTNRNTVGQRSQIQGSNLVENSMESELKQFPNGMSQFARVDNPFISRRSEPKPQNPPTFQSAQSQYQAVPQHQASSHSNIQPNRRDIQPLELTVRPENSVNSIRLETSLADQEKKIVENHLNFAGRYARKGAFMMAHSEATNALKVIAKARKRNGENPLALKNFVSATNAYKEMEDFSEEAKVSTYPVNTIVKGHQTPILARIKDETAITKSMARNLYMRYAEDQLLNAVGQHPLSSHALHTLGKIQLVQSKSRNINPADLYLRAGSYFRVSLRSDQGNAKSANDLGVWSAQQNQLEQSRELLITAVQLSPLFSEAWKNLAKVHHRLGETNLARIASQQAISSERKSGSTSGIEFVSAEDFDKVGKSFGSQDFSDGSQVGFANERTTSPNSHWYDQGSSSQEPRSYWPNSQNAGRPKSNQQQQQIYAPFGTSRNRQGTPKSQQKTNNQPNFLQRSWENRPRLGDLLPWSKKQTNPATNQKPVRSGGF